MCPRALCAYTRARNELNTSLTLSLLSASIHHLVTATDRCMFVHIAIKLADNPV